MNHSPLADRMRPTSFEEIVGQKHLLGERKFLSNALRQDHVPSMILWGPPGSGKTTLANAISHQTQSRFIPFSAVLGGVPELRKVIQSAKTETLFGKTILFVDEIHRFNKAQQDALLPHVESGLVTLIGATTENPSFAVNRALLSRAKVVVLEPLSENELVKVLKNAIADDSKGLGKCNFTVSHGALEMIANFSQGDARQALNLLEAVFTYVQGSSDVPSEITVSDVTEVTQSKTLFHDKSGEEHYNLISAFIKSMRGSDPDASVYWLMRMLEAGEDPLFILRRMMIFASEDIGNADPRALSVSVDADHAFQRLGLPEGRFALAQCCIYLACAPKSNASYVAWTSALEDVNQFGNLSIPKKLRNAPTSLMKGLGYGKEYRYPHEHDGFVKGETYLPEKLVDKIYYYPKDSGLETKIREKLEKQRSRGSD